jgi:hypothetical protein
MTAPREPSRAIATVRKAAPPAVEAPPPHLTLPTEEVGRTKPARRRRTKADGVAGELETTTVVALAPAPSTTRVRRKTSAAAATTADAKPKASGVKKTSTRKKASTSTSTRKKKAT